MCLEIKCVFMMIVIFFFKFPLNLMYLFDDVFAHKQEFQWSLNAQCHALHTYMHNSNLESRDPRVYYTGCQ